MQTKKRRESILFATICFLAITAPAVVLWSRSIPPRAQNADQLWIQVFSRERGIIETELGQRNSSTVTIAETNKRWAVLKQSMLDQGAKPSVAQDVLDTARGYCPSYSNGNRLPHWPILVKLGYVRNKPIWVCVFAVKAQDIAEIYTGWEYCVRTVNPEDTHALTGIYSSNQGFQRCEGPNTPFPIGR